MPHSNIPKLIGIYLFVEDLDRSLGFYRSVGLEVERVSDVFARALSANSVVQNIMDYPFYGMFQNGIFVQMAAAVLGLNHSDQPFGEPAVPMMSVG